MFRRLLGPVLLVSLLLGLMACSAPAPATPTPTKAPPVAPTQAPAAAPTKASEPAKPAAATPTTAAAAPAPKPATIKLGYGANSVEIGIYLAIEKGYFKEQGIDLETVPVRSAADTTAFLGTGQLDVAVVALGQSLFEAIDRGLDIRIIADAGKSRPGNEYVWIDLRKDLADSGQVKTAADLKGMKINTISTKTDPEMYISKWVTNAGLKLSDVELVTIGASDIPSAFAGKAISASFTSEPVSSLLVKQGLAVKWIPWSSFFGGSVQQGQILAGQNLVRDQDLGRRFAIAYVKALRTYLDNLATPEGRKELVNILMKYTPAKDPAQYEGVELQYVDPNGALDLKSMQDKAKGYVEMGWYKGSSTLDRLVDQSYVEYAVQKLGKR